MQIRVILTLGCLVLLSLCACSSDTGEQKAEDEPGPVDPATGIAEPGFEWKFVGGPPVTFYYEPDDSLEPRVVRLRNKIVEVYRWTAQTLELYDLVPIEFYCYKDAATLEKYTSRTAPFYIGDKMYYGYGPPFGRVITLFILGHVKGEPTHFQFMEEGIPTLFDWSGRNYHKAADDIRKAGRLASVEQITANVSFDSLSTGLRPIQSASLIGYIMYNYGPALTMQLYHSQESFPEACQAILGIDMADLDQGWRVFLPQHVAEVESETESEE